MIARRLRLWWTIGVLALSSVLPARAQVAQPGAWALASSRNPNSNAINVSVANISAAAGSNRVFVVVALLEAGAAGTVSNFNASFGGTAMTAINGTQALSQRCTARAWYLPQASIPGAPANLTVTGTHQQTVTGLHVFYATFSGVDQASPIASSAANAVALASVTFGTAVNYLQNGMTFYGANNGGSPATETPPSGFTQQGTETTNGFSSFLAGTAVHGANGSYAGTTTVTFGGTTSTRSAIVVVSLRPAPANTTTIGNGTPPPNASLCPGSALTDLDAFTLVTDSGTDSVTSVTASLTPAGAYADVGTIAITNNAGTTTYGASVNPTADTTTISLSTPIPVSTTTTTFKIRIQPKSHAAMPAPPGASYPVQGVISAFTSSNNHAGANTTAGSATLTLDNLSTANPAWGTNTPGNAQVTLNWTNPADADFNSVLILRKAGSAVTDTPAEGTTYTAPGTLGASTVIYAGTAQTFTDTGLTNGTAYYYAIFARDTCGNWSTGAAAGPYTPSAPVPPVTPGTPSAAVNSCAQITVSAPYTGDTNGNSTTTVSRGPSSTGPWTAVCTSLTGASPRTCVDNGVSASSTYYYQVSFSDPDGVVGTNPQVVGPYTTPSCAQNGTTAGTASASITGCLEISVLAPFSGDDNGNGSVKVEYNTSNTWPGTVACAAATGPSPRQCVITTSAPGAYYVRVTYSDPDGTSGTAVQVLPGTYTTVACGGDTTKPVVTVLAPSRNGVVAGADTFKVQVYDANPLDATAPVQFALDGGTAYTTVSAPSPNYSCGTGCGVFELPVPAQAAGSHFITIRAKDASGNVNQVVWPFQARASTTQGTGKLLRRTEGSQLCLDCHALSTHSAQYTSTRYGSWAVDCTTCHTPHKTYNVKLVRDPIETPNSGTKTVVFHTDDAVGGTNPQNSYLGAYTSDANATPTDDGICEVCHTRTSHYRNDSSGGDHTHNRNQRCVGCHQHGNGFGANESDGCGGSLTPSQAQCSNCHPAIWQAMTGAVPKNFKHTLGAIPGTNDSCSDSGITWASPLSAHPPTERSCTNMCHPDHVHNNPGGTTHDYNAHQDATSSGSRAVTRGAGGVITAGTPARTDFDAAATNGGMCLSCHRFPVESGANPPHPALAKAAFAASAHNYTSNTVGASTYTWTYTQHDGSTFDRNCTKCHSDRADGGPNSTSSPFGAVHFSDYKNLLAGSSNPAGSPASFLCYNCHGNGTTGQNTSGKDIATQIVKTYRHPADADTVHDSVTEFASAAFGNTLGVTGRHANCMDCHAPHQAKAGTAASPGNLAGPPLEGAWGAQLSSNPAFWSDTAAGNFTKKTLVAGADLEATLCFKCHTRYYWGTGTPPTSPSGGFAETDVAKEFNPNNVGNFAGTWANGETAGGFHPILATAGSNLGAVNLANLVTTNIPWSTTARNLMSCTDCHESNNTADPNGPHGSTASFLLRGPNTNWSGSVVMTSTGMPAGTFCANCHSPTFASSRFTQHYSRSNHRVACWNCHAAIPHGGPRPGMLIAPAGASANVGGTIAGWDNAAPYWRLGTSNSKLYIVSYPANSTTGWAQNNCGCNGTGH